MTITMYVLNLLVMLAVVLRLNAAERPDDEAQLDGPRGLRVFVGRKGGTIRLHRLLPPPPPKGDEEGRPPSPPPRPTPPGPRKPSPRSGEIRMSFGRIQEVDSSSRVITGNHGVKNPNSVDFVVTTNKNTELQNSGVDEIRGDCLSCIGTLKDAADASMTLTVCVINTNGTMKLDDEEAQVYAGQLKFSVQLERWPWSDGGKYIDVDVITKVPPGRAMRQKERGGRGRPVAFELGADAAVFFSRKIKVDNTWRDMEDGYPKFDNKGANNIVTVRVPRFSNYSFYDPTVEAGYQSGSSAREASFLATFAALICFIAQA